MRIRVLEQITLPNLVLHPGEILEVPESLLPRLGERIQEIPVAGDGRDLPHYCRPAARWCSSKLVGNKYPAECIMINCNDHNAQ